MLSEDMLCVAKHASPSLSERLRVAASKSGGTASIDLSGPERRDLFRSAYWTGYLSRVWVTTMHPTHWDKHIETLIDLVGAQLLAEYDADE